MNRTRIIAIALVLSLALQSCGGGTGNNGAPSVPAARTTPPATKESPGAANIATPLATSLAAPPAASSSILVNSTADEDARDGAVTLREAISLATGALAPEALDSEERRGISGSPGLQSADTITFGLQQFPPEAPEGIVLGEPLPVFTSGFDVVDASARGVIIDGG